MKWLIVDRLTRARLMSLSEVCSSVQNFFVRANHRLQEAKVLELIRTQKH